jgi:hypothetical protein
VDAIRKDVRVDACPSARVAIAAYPGKSHTFGDAIATFSRAYADLSEQDHAAPARSVRSGRIAAESGILRSRLRPPTRPARTPACRRPSARGMARGWPIERALPIGLPSFRITKYRCLLWGIAPSYRASVPLDAGAVE